jgi:hypothetical protein
MPVKNNPLIGWNVPAGIDPCRRLRPRPAEPPDGSDLVCDPIEIGRDGSLRRLEPAQIPLAAVIKHYLTGERAETS